MRIVYFVSLFPCWSETFIVREIQALIDRGVDVRIVSLRPPSETLVQDDAAALLPRAVHPPPAWRLFPTALMEALRAPLATGSALVEASVALWRRPVEWVKTVGVLVRTLALLPMLRAMAPQHLHAHWATYPSTAAMLASRCLGRPFSFTVHAHDLFRHDHLIAEKLERAAFTVAISRFNRNWLLEHHATPERATPDVRVVHCGIPVDALDFRPPSFVPGRRRVVAVGRLDPIKGFAHLVAACAELSRRGEPVDCRIVGDGPLRASLQAAIDAAGLRSSVRLMGALPQAQVQRCLESADVCVLPSVVTPEGDRDGIPVALMEAMARGLPVVSTPVSGIPELVASGHEGLLATAGDPVALADAIARQLSDRGAAAVMARAARLRIEAAFDVQIEAARLHEAFTEAVAGSRTPPASGWWVPRDVAPGAGGAG